MREPVDKRQCQAVTARGNPCKASPLSGESFCLLHMPGADPAAMGAIGGRARGRGRVAGDGGGAGVLVRSGSGLKTIPEDPRPILEQLADIVRQELAEIKRTGQIKNAQGLASLLRQLAPEDAPRGPMDVEDARAELIKRFDDIDARRGIHSDPCSACGGAGYVMRERQVAEVRRSVAPKEISPVSPRTADGPQGALRDDIRSLEA